MLTAPYLDCHEANVKRVKHMANIIIVLFLILGSIVKVNQVNKPIY